MEADNIFFIVLKDKPESFSYTKQRAIGIL